MRGPAFVAGLVALGFAVGCGEDDSSDRGGSQPAPVEPKAEARAEPKPDASAPEGAYKPRRAVRCANCHEESFAQWEGSAHATSHEAPYPQALEHAKDMSADAGCGDCHTPLAVGNADHAALRGAGVTCEACHGIAAIEEGEGQVRPVATYRLATNEKFGPNCDAQEHYFHKMGCGPHTESSAYCGSCHSLEVELGDGSRALAIADFADWKASAYADGMTCQDCHMPWENQEAAVGSGTTRSRGHHGDRGADDALAKDAVQLRVLSVANIGDAQKLELEIENKGAGHALPAGLPSRRLVVELEPLDAKGVALPKVRVSLGRTWVDAKGEAVPFYAAEREAADTRLAAGEKRPLEFSLPANARRVRAFVYDQTISAEVARHWAAEPKLRTMLELEFNLKDPP